jgi:hypothetical protein
MRQVGLSAKSDPPKLFFIKKRKRPLQLGGLFHAIKSAITLNDIIKLSGR